MKILCDDVIFYVGFLNEIQRTCLCMQLYEFMNEESKKYILKTFIENFSAFDFFILQIVQIQPQIGNFLTK